MKRALFYKKLKNKVVLCELCPNYCSIKSGGYGLCKIRKNISGDLYALSYERPVSINIDPIEKKPLYHFLSKTFTFSIGMAGCNFSCKWCQNWDLSQTGAENQEVEKIKPEKIIEEALNSSCPSISYTYSEPLVSYEYVLDIMKLARKKGLKNIVVTNGFINERPFNEIKKYIDAANIDLKGFSEKSYKKYCGVGLKPVLESIKRFYEAGIPIEITTLIIPDVNDSVTELKKIAGFIFKLDKRGDIPWHISRFFPVYRMKDRDITPIETLRRAEEIGRKEGLKFVYIGNI